MKDIAWICWNLDGQKKQIKQYDALALEDHSNEATHEERGRFERSWHISLNKEGTQGPIRQRPDCREAKHTYLQLYTEHVESTGEGHYPIHPDKSSKTSSSTI